MSLGEGLSSTATGASSASGGWKTLAGETESDDENTSGVEGNGNEKENGHENGNGKAKQELQPAAEQDTSAVYHDTATKPKPIVDTSALPTPMPELNVVAPSPVTATNPHPPSHLDSSSTPTQHSTSEQSTQPASSSPDPALSHDPSLPPNNPPSLKGPRQRSMPGSFSNDTDSEQSVERPASPATGSRAGSPARAPSPLSGFAARMKKLVIG